MCVTWQWFLLAISYLLVKMKLLLHCRKCIIFHFCSMNNWDFKGYCSTAAFSLLLVLLLLFICLFSLESGLRLDTGWLYVDFSEINYFNHYERALWLLALSIVALVMNIEKRQNICILQHYMSSYFINKLF